MDDQSIRMNLKNICFTIKMIIKTTWALIWPLVIVHAKITLYDNTQVLTDLNWPTFSYSYTLRGMVKSGVLTIFTNKAVDVNTRNPQIMSCDKNLLTWILANAMYEISFLESLSFLAQWKLMKYFLACNGTGRPHVRDLNCDETKRTTGLLRIKI